jgi:hypothetical protein
MSSVCTHVCTHTSPPPPHVNCALLVPERINEFYSYSVFKGVAPICQCPVNMNILAPGIRVLWMDPKIRNWKIICALRVLVWNVKFIRSSFTGQRYISVLRYLVTDSVLQSKFYFLSNLIRVSLIYVKYVQFGCGLDEGGQVFSHLRIIQTGSEAHPSSSSLDTKGTFSRWSGQGVKLTSHLKLMPRSRKCRSIHAFTAQAL